MKPTVAKILLVEDSPSDADVLQEMLHQTGPDRFDFTWVERLDEALARLRQEAFDALLLDLSLPDSTGPNTFLSARQAAPQLPIVVLTGANDEAIGLEAVRHGVQDYLVKGHADGPQIARTIRYAIERNRAEQALRDREEELAAIYENAPLVMLLMDGERRVRKVNKQAEAFAGASATDLLGRSGGEALRCLHALDDPRGCGFGRDCQHCALHRTVLKTFETGRSHRQLETALSFAVDGKQQDVTFLLSTSRLNVRGEPLVLVTMHDITARKQAEEALQRAHNELELRVHERTAELQASNALLQRAIRGWRTLSACNEALVRTTSEAELLDNICRVIVEVSGYRMAWVGFADQDKRKTVRPVAKAGFEGAYLRQVNVTWADAPRGRGPTGTAIRTAQVVVNRNFLTNRRLAPWRADAIKRGYASSVALPLLDNGRCLGALTIYAAEPEAFNAEEVALLRELASDMSFGIIALRTRAERERLQAELLQIAEREQRRIGQDLHDGLGQRLTGVSYLSGALQQRLAARAAPEAAAALRIAELSRQAINDARNLSHGLNPLHMGADGLVLALRELAGTVSVTARVSCRFVCRRTVLVHDNTVALHLFRIAQEAVNNALKHGRARHVTIRLRAGPAAGQATLRVQDDGRGLPKKPRKTGGMGLETMRYRAATIGGMLAVGTALPRGVVVECLFPNPGPASKKER